MTAQGMNGRNRDGVPFYKQVADKLIEQIEQGTAPWQKPWVPDLPLNPVSGTRYKGANTLMLMAQGREDNRWMTYNQAAANGYQVRRGEKSTPVQYWKFTEDIPKLDGDGNPVMGRDGKPEKVTVELQKPKMFTSYVFNAEQIDGIPPLEKREITWNPNERAEKMLRDSGAKIANDQVDRAFYSSRQDEIHLPKKEQFQDQEH
jgi:antirestriction protein ArdC